MDPATNMVATVQTVAQQRLETTAGSATIRRVRAGQLGRANSFFGVPEVMHPRDSCTREICTCSLGGGRRPARGRPCAPPPTRQRRRRSNVLPGDGIRLPRAGSTGSGQRGSGTWRFHRQRDSRTQSRRYVVAGLERDHGQTWLAGAYANQRLNLAQTWEGTWKICHVLEPDLRNSAVRHYWGASGNVVMAGMGTHLATQRVRLVTPRLPLASPSSIPTTGME